MQTDRGIHKQIILKASLQKTWNAWTTKNGLTSFFGKDCNIDLRIGGAYEILFMLDAAEGARGSEGCQILAIEPQEMLSFTWNAPPHFPHVRTQRTFVILRFTGNDSQSICELSHYGWGSSEEWTSVFHYFDSAWARVFENLKNYVETK